MEAVLDIIWEYLAAGFNTLGETLFSFLQNLHFLGPIFVISFLALCTVLVTKILNRVIITKRYLELEKIYQKWFQLRQEAMSCDDREKGKRMARNIDKAELNKAYYDYFFEGFLLGIARKVIPIFFIFAFINEFYRPENMFAMFGREYLVKMVLSSGEPVLVGAVFYYFLSLVAGYLLWFLCSRVLPRGEKNKNIMSRRVEEASY